MGSSATDPPGFPSDDACAADGAAGDTFVLARSCCARSQAGSAVSSMSDFAAMPSSPLAERAGPAFASLGWPLSHEGKAAESKSTGPLLPPARTFRGGESGATCGCGGRPCELGWWAGAGEAPPYWADAAGGGWYVGGILPRSVLAPSCRSQSGNAVSSYRLRPGVTAGSPSQGFAGSGEGDAGWRYASP